MREVCFDIIILGVTIIVALKAYEEILKFLGTRWKIFWTTLKKVAKQVRKEAHTEEEKSEAEAIIEIAQKALGEEKEVAKNKIGFI